MKVVDYATAAMGGTYARTFDQFRTLPDEVVAALVAERGGTVEVRHWGGRIARDSGAAAHRDAPLSVILDTVPAAPDRGGLRAPRHRQQLPQLQPRPVPDADGVHGGELGGAAPDQGRVRPGQLLPHRPHHPAVARVSRRLTPPAAPPPSRGAAGGAATRRSGGG